MLQFEHNFYTYCKTKIIFYLTLLPYSPHRSDLELNQQDAQGMLVYKSYIQAL